MNDQAEQKRVEHNEQGENTSRHETIAAIRKIVVLFVGSATTFVRIVMIVTPGPALIVIPTGLAILATEFHWAQKVRDKTIAEIRKRRPKASKQINELDKHPGD